MTPSPITPAEIADRLVPGAPVISPDGRHIAFTVAAMSRKDERWDRAIWMSTDGAPARRFTGGTGNYVSLCWHPDSSRLIFAAQRDDDSKFRLYVIPPDGGEARQIGDIAGPISDLTWSPDGKTIGALITDEDDEDTRARKENDKIDEVVYETDQHITRLYAIDPATGDKRCISPEGRHVCEYAWSLDGSAVYLTTGTMPIANERFRETRLERVTLNGASQDLGAFVWEPSSPVERVVNGEHTVFIAANDHRADPSASVWQVSLADGSRTKVIDNDASAVYGIAADPRNESDVLVVRHERANTVASIWDGALTPVAIGSLGADGSVIGMPSIAQDGTMAFVWSSLDHAPDVYRMDEGKEPQAVTTFGEGINHRLASGEVVTWTADDGTEIEGLLIYPHGYTRGTTYPLVVEVHGGPAWLWSNRLYLSWHDWAQMLAQEGIAVLLPNPRGSIGYGTAFEKLLQDDVGGGEYQDLVSGAQAMIDRGIADPDRLGIAGWSWGGYLSAWTITQTDMFKAAVMGAGVANNVSDHGAGDIAEYNTIMYPNHPYLDDAWDAYATVSPVRFANRVTAATLIVHGEADDRVHVSQGQEMYRALQVCGKDVQFVRYPREGHGFQERAHQINLMERIRDWFTSRLAG